MNPTKTLDTFIAQCILVHGTKYDYSLITSYVNNRTKVSIICPIHGIFYQTPSKHLCQRTECPPCRNIAGGIGRRSNTAQFIEKSTQLYGNRYDYSQVEYITAIKKVTIICTIHGVFNQRPNDHLNGYGCSYCGKISLMGFTSFPETKRLPAKLYLVKISLETEQFIKIGITTDNISARFRSLHFGTVEELMVVDISRYEAFVLEQQFLSKHKQLKYYPATLPKTVGGHTECFHIDYSDILTTDFKYLVDLTYHTGDN